MQQLVECVPNFSNGRHPAVYNSIADAIRAVPGVQVLDVSADPDHNRTVITFVGAPDAVEEAAFRAIAAAAEKINLDQHTGEHPRIGATDVCPFIPVRGITEKECVAIAERLGRRVGNELGIAVYLYGSAATRPDREKLADIRKGQYEKWKEEIGQNPDRDPDFGPAEPKPWGATVIGVRPFLIAYNIYLNTNDVDVAEKISRAIRFSSGGLRFVQAKGFLVEGQAQVSMNLTNFAKTPLYRVQEMVRREAARYGVGITKAELIGMIPQQALLDAARWYLQLDEMEDNQVLEARLAETAVPEEDSIVPHAFLDAAACNTPTPGGGSVAALAGALGAALTQMVAGLTVGRKKYANVDADARLILAEAAELRQKLTDAISEDAEAFDALMDAYRDKSLNDEARAAAIEAATKEAARVPLRVAQLARDAAELAQNVARIGNQNAVTDAAAGAIMACAAVRAAGLNVKVNVAGLHDQETAAAWRQQADNLKVEASTIADVVATIAAKRGGF